MFDIHHPPPTTPLLEGHLDMLEFWTLPFSPSWYPPKFSEAASCGVMARHGVGRHICHLVPYILQSECLVRVNQVVQWRLAM